MQRWILRRRMPRLVGLVGTLVVILGLALGAAPAAAKDKRTGTYTNPLPVTTSSGALVESCADPSVINGADGYWYMYCTSDPLNSEDRTASDFNFHKIPSSDQATWSIGPT